MLHAHVRQVYPAHNGLFLLPHSLSYGGGGGGGFRPNEMQQRGENHPKSWDVDVNHIRPRGPRISR